MQNNSTRAGGVIFNRGLVEVLAGSTITGNYTTTTGSSGETCTGSASCDGLGGGVLSVHISKNPNAVPPIPSGSDTRFMLTGSTISNPQARISGIVVLVLSQVPKEVTFRPMTCWRVSMSSVTLRPSFR